MAPTLHMLHTTVADMASAERLAQTLVGEGLVACAQIGGPVRSTYRWRGALEQATEIPLVFKVRGDRLGACCERLESLHPYDTPEVITVAADHVAPGYLAWAYAEDDT